MKPVVMETSDTDTNCFLHQEGQFYGCVCWGSMSYPGCLTGGLGEIKFGECPTSTCWASSSDFKAQRTGDRRILFSLPAQARHWSVLELGMHASQQLPGLSSFRFRLETDTGTGPPGSPASANRLSQCLSSGAMVLRLDESSTWAFSFTTVTKPHVLQIFPCAGDRLHESVSVSATPLKARQKL